MSIAVPATNSRLLDPDEQRVIEETRARRLQRLAVRERVAFVLFSGGFAVAAAMTALVFPSARSPGALTVALLVVVTRCDHRCVLMPVNGATRAPKAPPIP